MTNPSANVSDEIGALIEQHLHGRKQAELKQEKRRRWPRRVSTTVDALRQCTPAGLGSELVEELRTKDSVRLGVLLGKVVNERWQPAAAAVAELVGLPAFRRIPFPPDPLYEALFLLFALLVEEPENEKVRKDVTTQLTVLLARTGVEAGELFALFDIYRGEFERLHGSRILSDFPDWFVGPDPRGEGSCMEHDPRVVAIRKRLKRDRASRAIATLKKLCADARHEIPRAELADLGLSPNTGDRACRSGSDRRVRDDGQVLYRREFLIDYVCNRWNPHEDEGRAVPGIGDRTVEPAASNSDGKGQESDPPTAQGPF